MKPRAPLLRWLQGWRARAFAVGAGLALLATGASVLPVAWSWQEGFDLYVLFRARGPRPAPENVLLVPIDGRATSSLFLRAAADEFERCGDVRRDGPLLGYRNPDPPEILTRWPRCLHARALSTLAAAGPDALVMDISFRPRNDPSGMFREQDRVLAAEMRRIGKVVLVQKIKSDPTVGESAQPIASDITAAALAVAPFLVVGDQLQRADKFCTFKEDHGWSGPCLPAVVHQATSLADYAELRKLMDAAAFENADLMPADPERLIADGALQGSVRLIRHVAISDPRAAARLRELLASRQAEPGDTHGRGLRRLTEIYLGAPDHYFNFYGPPGAFRTLRYEALVAGSEAERPAPGSLQGKILFIGFAEHEQPEPIEHFTTPFTTAESIKLSGVELAATAYANLQDGSAIEPASAWSRALITLSAGLVCTLLCIVLRPMAGLSLCLAGMLGYFAVALGVFHGQALWLPLLMPLGVAAPAAVTAGLASRYLELKRQRDRSHEVNLALLPPRVVDRIVNDNQKLSQLLRQLRETVYGTCVYTDLQGFTTFAESRPADELARIMDEYFQALFQVVVDVGGETSDIAGDGMLAVWADVAPDPALRRRACSAALQLAATAGQLGRKQSPGLPMRVGMDYGPMSRGMLGGSFHIEYRHSGDVPNSAQRLQSLNKQLKLETGVLASAAVLDGLDGFLTRYVGNFTLQGKQRSTQVHQLISERASADSRQLLLCELFGEALACYQSGSSDEARGLFEALLVRFPGDGPSKFYGQLCKDKPSLGSQPIPVA